MRQRQAVVSRSRTSGMRLRDSCGRETAGYFRVSRLRQKRMVKKHRRALKAESRSEMFDEPFAHQCRSQRSATFAFVARHRFAQRAAPANSTAQFQIGG